MMRKFWLFIVLWLSFSLKIIAQDGMERYQKMADNFYTQSDFSSAIEVYERLLFFGNDNLDKQIYLPLARCYQNIGEYEMASVHYNNAYNSQTVDTVRYEIIFESALNSILANDTSQAYSELLNIPETRTSRRINNKLHFLIGTLDYKSGRYTDAKKHFLTISILDNSDKFFIDKFFIKTSKINRRFNPKMVKWMSIIPGLGQAWCGYYKESANALLLTSALVALYINVSINYKVLDGLLTVYPWFNRYYKGGINKSYKLAVQKRETEKNKLYNSLLKTLPPIN